MQFNYDLSKLNTLKLPAVAKAFASFNSIGELQALLANAYAQELPVKILGGGSNVLLTHNIDALVLKSAMHNIDMLEQTKEFTRVAVDAGVEWHTWVLKSVEFGHGLENLALIPGTVGAAPVQNIGAYGVEVGEYLEAVEGVELGTTDVKTINADECRFSYRDSIFKQELNGKFIITRVIFKLPREFKPKLNYGPLMQVGSITPLELIHKVCDIRRTKLPDPAIIPNAGSFFKNPMVIALKAQELKAQYETLPVYEQPNGDVKLAAGWLIEQAGWKGKWLGPVRMHDQQALVLTTNGRAQYSDIEKLCSAVVESVRNQFGVELEAEPQTF